MALQPQNLTNLICGPFKFINPTTKRDSSKRVIWACECVCGAIEYGAKADIIKFAGHGLECPGHPIKGKAKPLDGFTLDPDFMTTIEHAEMARDWELKRHPEQPAENRESEAAAEVSQENADKLGAANASPAPAPEAAPESPKPSANKTKSTDGSDVLRSRLGLINYRTECITLVTPVEMLSGKAEKVVFAKQVTGSDRAGSDRVDRVFLHIQLVDASNARSIVSSKKKIPEAAWAALSGVLAEMKIDWRERDKRRKAA